MSGTTPQFPKFDAATMQKSIRAASEALRKALSTLARHQAKAKRNRPAAYVDQMSRAKLAQHIQADRTLGLHAVRVMGRRASEELGLLPDCPLYDAKLLNFDTGRERPVQWCGAHSSEATHPRWCFVALGFNYDGGLR